MTGVRTRLAQGQLRLARSLVRLANLLKVVSTDKSGNALAIFAIAIVPMLALVGSSIDMGRAYLVESRLQQACDAGVLGARKELGT